MAEIVVKVGDANGYSDGDVISTFSDEQIAWNHVTRISNPSNLPTNSNGLRRGKAARGVLDLVMGYRCERVSKREYNKYPIPVVGEKAGDPVLIKEKNLPEWIRTVQAHPRHNLFGSPGSEVWYLAPYKTPTADLASATWAVIEANSPLRRVDHRNANVGVKTLKVHLAVGVTGMTRAQAQDWEKEEVSGTRILKKRAYTFNWKTQLVALGATLKDIEDKEKSIDVRDAKVLPILVSRKS